MEDYMTKGVCTEKHKRVDGELARTEKRLNEHGKEIDDIGKLLERQTVILDRLTATVQDMQAVPGRRWEAVVNQIISLVIATAFGALIASKFF